MKYSTKTTVKCSHCIANMEVTQKDLTESKEEHQYDDYLCITKYYNVQCPLCEQVTNVWVKFEQDFDKKRCTKCKKIFKPYTVTNGNTTTAGFKKCKECQK